MEKHVNDATRLRLLIYKQAKGVLTVDEQAQLDTFVNRSVENARLVKLLTTDAGYAILLRDQARSEKAWKGKHLHLTHKHYRRKRSDNYMQLSIVAGIVLALLIGVVYFLIWMSSINK
ncbi:hypothetical protein D3H65_01365 [Paraflavitalea soli]|uniref:Uncharacterized protein n=1 Tax=Paraflavitalea soli TaxID=2315862 RepID=A0A3B7MPY8_9BACT|nr:hypothetical protein [Paraflavitalea soli]AXY72701.1 hypothetical protein D3H65_01365 [Paraflavitalea soli]